MYQNVFPCPYCGTSNYYGSAVCAGCGATLIAYCPQCSAGNMAGSQFCQNCGAPFTQTSYAQGYPAQQPQPQQPYAYPQEAYPQAQYDPNQQAGYTPQYDPNQQTGYAPQYDPNQQTGYAPQYDPYQQTGYAPQYDPYQQQPVPPHPASSGWQYMLDGYMAKAKQIILTTNPVYFLILGVLVIGIAGFLAFAYQTGL
ncbi:MAG: zinc ribbon domain-containing protein, partial [Dehalococcoidia bacterium]|nr:zinc ribbon domain-containing protein [Dehalococcoidia bacterium]